MEEKNIDKVYEAISSAIEATQVSTSPPTTSTSTTQKPSSTSPTSNGKVKALQQHQQQQQQQQQQHHQFRTPQQFIKQRKSSNSALNKKNKTWNKRQNKISKQHIQAHSTHTSFSGSNPNTNISGALNLIASSGGSGAAGKADLENVQNIKSQLGGGSGGGSGASYNHSHYSHHHHHHPPPHSHGHGHPSYSGAGHRLTGNVGTIVGNIPATCCPECRSAASISGNCGSGVSVNLHASASLEKVCYGHGHHHLNKQLYKKIVAHRGHYHNHVLCAGAAHNTHGSGGITTGVCCLLHNCPTQNGGKDKETCSSHASSNSSVAGGATCSALHYCCGRAKFFLPDKRLRKEIIVPPTKFLLGGNISDPLNLNSLQNDSTSSNNTPATTPRRSPITTPPKVEVIIPPNIHDPLHLLDPVDSMEYEKQLTSPLKRHSRGPMLLNKPYKPSRNRKNRKNRRRHDSYSSTISSIDSGGPSNDVSGVQLPTEMLTVSADIKGNNTCIEFVSSADEELKIEKEYAEWNNASALTIESESTEKSTLLTQLNTSQAHGANEQRNDSFSISAAEYTGPVTRERASRDFRLELNLNSTTNSTCSSVTGLSTLSSGGGQWGPSGKGRKRKISESNNSLKNKKHRDSLDKIVSPVVPQPGAWKRPPRQAASGARKPSRRSTSISESDMLSPAEEVSKLWTNDNGRNVNTPENSKQETATEMGVASPQSIISGCTSIVAVEQELPRDTASNDVVPEDSKTDDSLTKVTKVQMTANDSDPLATPTALQKQQTTQVVETKSENEPKFCVDGGKYRYGNYDRYKGVRQLNEFIDVRLHIFSRNTELFQNKDVLDIGCNTGQMTISIARDLAPKSIVGIDIDKELIKRARRNLSMFVRIPQEKNLDHEEAAVAANSLIKKEIIKREVNENKVTVQGAATLTIDGTTDVIDSSLPLQSIKKKHKNRKSKKQRLAAAARAASRQPATAAHLMHHHHLLHHHHHHDFHHLNNNWHPGHQNNRRLHVNADELFPISFPLSFGGLDMFSVLTPPPSSSTIIGNDAKSPASKSTPGHSANALNSTNEFPRNVLFRQMNYILKDESQLNNETQQYDLILCLSVTKWIHLNFGDSGLKLAFKRMFNQLRPGGKLILEAQNWASYKKKSNLTAEIHKNYKTIEFFPNKFHEYLLSTEVGFSHSYTLGVPRHLNKGFGRPIQLYAKGDFTPNHVRWSDAYYPNTPFEEYRGIYAFMPPRSGTYAWNYANSSTRSQTYETPQHHASGGASGPYSSRQTPVYHPTYNPLETDSYQPSYDMDYMNHTDVFGSPGSPLYHTVWSPPASLRNSSSHTPHYGSVREAELDGESSGQYRRHVYPPNDDTFSPNANAGGAFNSIRDPDTDDSAGNTAVQHVYATHCGESSSSPQVLRPESEMIDETTILDEDAITGSNQNIIPSVFSNEQQ